MAEEQGSFFRSPWLWGGCGCCFGCVLIPILITALAGGGLFFAVRQSGVQEEVLERVRSDARVVERFGEPIEMGWLIEGSFNVEPGSGNADYSVPISGPQADGRVHVLAERIDGVWVYHQLYVDVDGERIDLLGTGSAPTPQAQPEESEGAEAAAAAEVVAALREAAPTRLLAA